MELLRKYGYIVLIIAVITVLVILRSTGTGHFRYDAKKWAEPSFSGSNIVTQSGLSTLKGEKLIIALDDGQQPQLDAAAKMITIPPDSILSKKYASVLREKRAAVILYSKDYSLSAKVWMVLSQAGFNNVFIYSADPENEVLKKEIRSDSLTRPD